MSDRERVTAAPRRQTRRELRPANDSMDAPVRILRTRSFAVAAGPFVCSLAMLVAGCRGIDAASKWISRGQLVRTLATAGLPRRWAPRLSVQTQSTACGTLDSLPMLRCPGAASSQSAPVIEIAARAAQTISDGIDSDALHAAALIDLSSSERSGKSVEQSVSYLEMLTRIDPASAAVYVDLSAARLASAASGTGARSLLGALDAASRALELDATDESARYNRALACDLLALNSEALKAWRAYLAHDSTSTYADEARARLAAIAKFGSDQAPDSDSTPQLFADYAERAPAEARVLVWERLLPAWGEALLRGDTATAGARLTQASIAAAVLANRVHEFSGYDAVQAIRRSQRDVAATRRLATLHATYGRSQQHAQKSAYAPADSGYLRILSASSLSPALRSYAAYGHANALIYHHQPAEALAAIDSLLKVLSKRYPAVVARTHWVRGVLLLRALRTDAGLASIHQAAALFGSIGERDYVASAIGIEGEMMLSIGSTARGYDHVQQAATALRNYPLSLWRHNVLLVLARTSARSGFPFATRAIEDEDMAVVGGGPRVTSVIEARLARARSAWSAGRVAASDTALAEARAAIAMLPADESRAEFDREVDLTMAPRLLRARPDSARVLLDAVISYFAPLHVPMKLIPALLSRSTLALGRGDTAAARADLDRAAATYTSARTDIATAAQGMALLTQARTVFNSLIMLRVNAGRPNEALTVLAQSRALFSRSRHDLAIWQTKANEASIDYALIEDTLLTWAVSRHDTAFVRQTVVGRRLSTQIERLQSAMELGTREPRLRRDLEALYETLLKPIESHLGPYGSSVVVSPDGEIANVPFAALRDQRRGKFLIELYSLRFAPTVAEPSSTADGPPRSSHALFVANPEPDRRTVAGLPALVEAEREVRDAAALYPGAEVLDGRAADSASVVNALEKADLFHFAGHAVFDDIEPDRSYLALTGRGLSANAIAGLRLARLKLVVLSACETMRSAQPTAGGFFGLSEAFFAAGARGVVGSTWRVDDGATRLFMQEFHRQYNASSDASRALRETQLSMIRGKKESPSLWAAFRFAGF